LRQNDARPVARRHIDGLAVDLEREAGGARRDREGAFGGGGFFRFDGLGDDGRGQLGDGRGRRSGGGRAAGTEAACDLRGALRLDGERDDLVLKTLERQDRLVVAIALEVRDDGVGELAGVAAVEDDGGAGGRGGELDGADALRAEFVGARDFAGERGEVVGGRQEAASNAKAAARWLMRCFSTGSISPKVSCKPEGTNIGS
jgi:hypothetical protein